MIALPVGLPAWLLASPLLGIFLTLLGYRIGLEIQRRTGGHALAQPVLVAIFVIGAAFWVFDLDYADYLRGAGIISFLLGPATVALAIPLHRQSHRLRMLALPMLIALPVGAFVSIASVILVVRACGGDDVLQRSMAPKAATTPVAIAISETIGGLPSLTVAMVIVAGIGGAVVGPMMLDLFRITDRRARGLAIGAVSHGIGTSRALREHPVEGALSGLSMGLTALLVSLLTPWVVWLLK